MTFPLSFAERAYGLVLLAYPRQFRARYENDMRLVFRDLLHDKHVSSWALARLMAMDVVAGLGRRERLPSGDLAKRSVLCGLVLVLFALMARSLHPGAYLGVTLIPIPFIAFIPAGFWGSRRERCFAGGMWAGLIMGALSTLSVLLDWIVFNHQPFRSAFEFIAVMAVASGICVAATAIGAVAGAATASSGESAS